MMREVKRGSLSTGEDVNGKVTKRDVIEVEKAFVIIPMRNQPGQPVQLMMTPYMPYSADEKITFDTDKVVTIVKPKDDILKSYQANTSSILTPSKELITETKLP